MNTTAKKPKQPIKVQQKHLEYLDELRLSGVTNMFGAAPYVSEEFGITVADARHILSEWMRTFSDRHPNNLG